MDNKRLFVGNLKWETTEETLMEVFGQFGKVEEASIVMDRNTGRPRGFAFVTMSTEEEADAAVEGMNNQELDGRRLIVNKARPREEGGRRDDRGGFRRDDRGGFNRGGDRGGFRRDDRGDRDSRPQLEVVEGGMADNSASEQMDPADMEEAA